MKKYHSMATVGVVVGAIAVIGMIAGAMSSPAVAQSQSSGGESAAPARPSDVHADSLARLPKVKRADLDAEGKRVFDQLVNPTSDGLSGPIGMWIYSPPMAEHLFANNIYLRTKTQFDQ